jgi:hypothetical protein
LPTRSRHCSGSRSDSWRCIISPYRSAYGGPLPLVLSSWRPGMGCCGSAVVRTRGSPRIAEPARGGSIGLDTPKVYAGCQSNKLAVGPTLRFHLVGFVSNSANSSSRCCVSTTEVLRYRGGGNPVPQRRLIFVEAIRCGSDVTKSANCANTHQRGGNWRGFGQSPSPSTRGQQGYDFRRQELAGFEFDFYQVIIRGLVLHC